MMYRIREEYLENWGADVYTGDLVTTEEIERLAREWDRPVDELMEQVEEVDDQIMAEELEQLQDAEEWYRGKLRAIESGKQIVYSKAQVLGLIEQTQEHIDKVRRWMEHR